MHRKIRKPNLFIVGAPKSGTTAMYRYLKAHPDIFMSDVKEPYFFGSDLIYRMPRMTMDTYLSLFRMVRNEKKIGEASVTYLYSRKAAREINAFNQSVKIIIMLRNPVEMIYSLHSQCLYTGTEDIVDFVSALEAEEDRKKNLRIPQSCKDIVNYLFYRNFGKYTEQVKRYFQIFGRENTHIIIFDDFKEKIDSSYQSTLSFLEVETNFRPPTFDIINRNKSIRINLIRKFLNYPLIVKCTRFLIPVYSWRQYFAHFIYLLNIRHSNRPPIRQELKSQLQKEFYPDIEQLSVLLKRDLTHWCSTE
jgi:hypothetical protein